MRTRLPLLAALGLFAAITVGCQPGGASSKSPDANGLLTVQPAWEQFVDDNYRGLVLAELSERNGAKFVAPPRVIASRDEPGGGTRLLAVGDVDVPDVVGGLYRRTYAVSWRQEGNRWKVDDVQIDPARLAPKPAAPPAQPVPVRPTTAPAPATAPAP